LERRSGFGLRRHCDGKSRSFNGRSGFRPSLWFLNAHQNLWE
jgi:hypothetical protein